MMYDSVPRYVAYGTAGFRTSADILSTVMYRVGLLAALRSRFHNGKYIGVMITASHNPPGDNGAKLVDPSGDMLEEAWEAYATQLANAPSAKDASAYLEKLYAQFGLSENTPANVITGIDTRESGPRLERALRYGIEASHGTAVQSGLVTTPQLHYLVRASNSPKSEAYGDPTLEGYYSKLARGFHDVLADYGPPPSVIVDCANGVGAPSLEQLVSYVNGTKITPKNTAIKDTSVLNMGCGADYVKTNQCAPERSHLNADQLYASFDGDADRVVFYYTNGSGFHLLDGDKIASLAIRVLQKLVAQTQTEITIGAVQTAYANGASTTYMSESLHVPVVCTATGVKHLHHEAKQFGIGVYFEANGHGTVLFSENALDSLRLVVSSSTGEQKASAQRLLAFSELVNQTVGDALSDLLMVVAMLTLEGWSPAQWDSCYTSIPNRLLKASVKDRTQFQTTDAERRLLKPEGLQEKIDELVGSGRAFVRPSGTEDVVRVYAEAGPLQEDADRLAERVKALLG